MEEVARPPRDVFSWWRLRGSLERFGFGGFTPSGGGWCCSGTVAVDPAWRWSSRFGAVYIFQFSVDAGHAWRFSATT